MKRVFSAFVVVLLASIGWTIVKTPSNDVTDVEIEAMGTISRPGIDIVLMDLASVSYLVSICSFNEYNEQIRNILVYLAETDSQNAPKALMVIARVSSALHSMKHRDGDVVDGLMRDTLCTEDNRLIIKKTIHEIEDHIRWYSDYVL